MKQKNVDGQRSIELESTLRYLHSSLIGMMGGEYLSEARELHEKCIMTSRLLDLWEDRR